jgi:hypothetical protein
MKKTVIFIFTVFLLFSLLACGQEGKKDKDIKGEDTSDSKEKLSIEITLTQALLDKYIKTLPPFAQRAREVGEDVETVGAAWLAGSEMLSLLKDYGWDTPEEFAEVHTKVWALTPWLIMSEQMKGQPDEMQEQLLEQFEGLFDDSGITEQEKQLIINNKEKLIAALEEAEK